MKADNARVVAKLAVHFGCNPMQIFVHREPAIRGHDVGLQGTQRGKGRLKREKILRMEAGPVKYQNGMNIVTGLQFTGCNHQFAEMLVLAHGIKGCPGIFEGKSPVDHGPQLVRGDCRVHIAEHLSATSKDT